MKQPRKPDIIEFGGVRARPIRPPTKQDPRWYWRLEHGRHGHLGTGRWTEAEVRAQVAEVVAKGLGPEVSPGGPVRTMLQLLGVWLSSKKQDASLRPATHENCSRTKRRLVGTLKEPTDLGRMTIRALRATDVEGWFHAQLRRGASPLTAYNDVSRLKEAWVWGVRAGLHDRPPLDIRIRHPRQGLRPKPTPVRADIPLLLEHMGTAWARAALIAFAMTGARLGEIAELRPEDVQRRPPRLRLGMGRSAKTGVRFVEVPGRLLEELAPFVEAPGADGRIWPVTYGTFLSGFNLQLHAAARAAGLEDLTSHALRRSAADWYCRRGAELASAAAQLGQTPETLLRHYRRVTDADQRAALEAARLDDFTTGAVVRLEDRR